MSVDEWDDDEWSEEEDWPGDDDGESLTRPCPSCHEEIYEDAEQCPYCGEYVVHSSTAWEGKPTWWILLGLLGVVATIVALTAL